MLKIARPGWPSFDANTLEALAGAGAGAILWADF